MDDLEVCTPILRNLHMCSLKLGLGKLHTGNHGFCSKKWLSCNSFLKSVARELVLAISGLAPSISHNFCRPGTQEDSIPQALSARLWFAVGASFTAFAYGSDS
jgi:hypothetical protein